MDELNLTLQNFQIKNLGKATYRQEALTANFVKETNRIVFHAHYDELATYIAKKAPIPTLELAGPREKLFFNPANTKIGIITCGGLCPGLNSVIRAIVVTSEYFYGIKEIYGFRNGYQGLNPQFGLKPMRLNADMVDNIHEEGGTILGASRGPQDSDLMAKFLKDFGINVLFVIGGDGTMRGALDLSRAVKKLKADISVIGIPKTIDNDILLIERSFGFETAVEEASKAIHSAHAESKGTPNGIGLVKLMGRESGFIASSATLASGVVNYCLIPENPFKLENLLAALEKRLKIRKHAVIVVAEGAGQDLIQAANQERDRSGNIKLQDIGFFLKEKITTHFKKQNFETSVKYIDPSYMIRSVAANADDNVFCLILGQNAVHAGMAGKTEMVIGYRNDHFVHIPMEMVTQERKKLITTGRIWQTILDTTRQPAL